MVHDLSLTKHNLLACDYCHWFLKPLLVMHIIFVFEPFSIQFPEINSHLPVSKYLKLSLMLLQYNYN